MAYQVRQRDPLFDADTQALLERRGKEMIGMILIALAGLAAILLATYSPNDPSWLSATDQPVQNGLGRLGASVASPLYIILGLGSWSVVFVLGVWGARLMTHHGSERAISRLIFAPIGVAVIAVYASTLVPYAGWGHSFGLGGLLGDTVLGAVLGVAPVSAGLGLKIMSGLFGLGALWLGAFALGFTRPELKTGLRFILFGLVVAYASVTAALVAAMRGLAYVMRALWSAWTARGDAAIGEPETEIPEFMAFPVEESAPVRTLSGLFGNLPGMVRRAVPTDVAGAPSAATNAAAGAPTDEHIRERIASVIKSRGHPTPVLTADVGSGRREPPVIREAPAAELAGQTDEGRLPTSIQSGPVAEPADRALVQPTAKRATQSRRAKSEAQPGLFDTSEGYELPPLSLLTSPSNVQRHVLSDEALEENARMLEAVLDDYGVRGDIVSVRPGPVVTMYELEPAPGLKASRVIGLSDDIARSMSALSARVSTVPGRSVIGIELPNEFREKVVLREILSHRDFGDGNQRLPLALGKDIGGEPVVANLSKMPHLLIAGTTGSGKSVAINTMILSLLYKLTPDECRMIMIDPKMLELSVYDGIPHLLSPVVTDPRKAVVALKWVVGEMEERYRIMSKTGVRNIEGFNSRVRDALARDKMFSRTVQTGFDDETGEPVFETEEFAPEKLPYIVVVVDEMADLMLVAGKEIEACIQRLAQMARASGIHLIMATQRPSVDVITGTIKANFPTRISFHVTGKIDSRTILGEQGAEQLLGMGDMLYMAGGAKITRVHGPFVSDEEVEEVVTYLKAYGPPAYVGGVVDGPENNRESDIDLVLGLGGNSDGEDALYDQAVQIVITDRKCSTSYIQRKLAIGYNKAARLVEAMEDQGLVSPANHVGKRQILVPEHA